MNLNLRTRELETEELEVKGKLKRVGRSDRARRRRDRGALKLGMDSGIIGFHYHNG